MRKLREVICKPFREGHADIFQCNPEDLQQFRNMLPMMSGLGQREQCGSHIVDGRIIYIGGWYDTAPGVAELFIYPSIYTKEYLREYLTDAKWWVQDLKSKYHRVQCWGDDTEVSKRWLSHLGFVYEGTLRSYTMDGRSMLIWGLV